VRYLIEHEACLSFAAPVREHHCELRWTPREDVAQSLLWLRLEVEPAVPVHDYVDYFSNGVQHFDIVAPHEQVRVELRAEVETLLENPFDFALLAPHQERRWLADTLRQQPRLWDYVLHRSALTPELDRLDWGDLEPPRYDPQRSLIHSVLAARDWISCHFDACVDEPPRGSLAKLLETRAGSAADLAHLLIGIVRRWGFPARLATGYHDDPDDEAATAAPHAWAEVLVPGGGWRGFDPTTGLVADSTFVTVGSGRDAGDLQRLRSNCKGAEAVAERRLSARLQRQGGAQQQ
jgi:transglutaminase-like putative cysteine protease